MFRTLERLVLLSIKSIRSVLGLPCILLTDPSDEVRAVSQGPYATQQIGRPGYVTVTADFVRKHLKVDIPSHLKSVEVPISLLGRWMQQTAEV